MSDYKHIIVIMLLAVSFISCMKDPQEDVVKDSPVELMRFTACNDTACDTRTYLDDNNVMWHKDDVIGVHDKLISSPDDNFNKKFKIESINSDGSAIFTGEATKDQDVYYATYPYDPKNYVTAEGRMRIGFLSNQTASAPGTFDKTFNSSAAMLKDGKLYFRNLGGLLKFNLKDQNVTKVTLKANDGGTVGGVYYIYLDGNGNIDENRTTMPSNGKRTTMYLTPSGSDVFAAGDYYFVLSARTYKGGMNITFTLKDGTLKTASCNQDIVVERSKITNIGSFSTVEDSNSDSTLEIMSATDMNKGSSEVNSHADMLDRSVLTPVGGTYVTLGETVMKDSRPVYPRFVKTAKGDYLMFYHTGATKSNGGTSWAGNECQYMRSTDLVNWTWEQKLFKASVITDCTGKSNKRGYAGANMVTLAGGDILSVASTRAITSYRDRNADNGLAIRISHDNGLTWDAEQIVHVGTNWEPMPVVLPSGRIHIYYTDSKKLSEGAFGSGKEVISSGTSYIWSDDNGQTWHGGSNNAAEHLLSFAQVRYEYGSQLIMTDQMPAVIALNGSNRLAAAAESFIGGASYTSYISLAYTDENGNWGTPDARGVLPKDRNDNFIKGCAPYLVQFPSGESVLAYNRDNVFYMRQGNAQARSFRDEIRVFDEGSGSGNGFWGTLYCFGSHSMVAGIGGSGSVMQVGQFYLNHAIKASGHNAIVDGSNKDWYDTDEALYICQLEQAKASLRCSKKGDYVYFAFDVQDRDVSINDYVSLYLSDASNTSLSSTTIRIRATCKGLKDFCRYKGGTWTQENADIEAAALYNASLNNSSDTDKGYVVEFAIPASALPISAGKLLVNASLHDDTSDASIVDMSGTSTNKWMIINNL